MKKVTFRELRLDDIEDTFSIRSRTRQNPISKEQLAAVGITPDSVALSMTSGNMKGWACAYDSTLIGFCIGDSTTGEVLVLAVLSDFEGKGFGSQLLLRVVQWLRSVGFDQPWLSASPIQDIRAHGFYRALGWQPNGKTLENGDEILVLSPRSPLQPFLL